MKMKAPSNRRAPSNRSCSDLVQALFRHCSVLVHMEAHHGASLRAVSHFLFGAVGGVIGVFIYRRLAEAGLMRMAEGGRAGRHAG